MDEHELRRQIELLKKHHAKMEEEYRALSPRSERARVQGEILKMSQQELDEKKQKLAEIMKFQMKPKQTEISQTGFSSTIPDSVRSRRVDMDAEKMKSTTLGKPKDDISALITTDLKELELPSTSKPFDIRKPHSEPVSPVMEAKVSNSGLTSTDFRFSKYDSLDDLWMSRVEKEEQLIKEKAPAVKPRTDYKEILELKKLNSELSQTVAELQSQIDCLQSEKAEMVKVNHAWEAQYRKLQEHTRNELKNKDNSFHQLQKQLSQEHKKSGATESQLLEQKDTVIEEQAAKIRALKEELGKIRLDSMQYMQNKYENDMEMRYQRAKKLFQEQRKENEILVKREQAVAEECQILKEENQILKEEGQMLKGSIQKLRSRNGILETELQRLAGLVEEFAAGAGKREKSESRSSPASLMLETRPGTRRQDSLVSAEQIEVLKQQIAIYAEDFNSEKEEKDGLLAENKRLKERLRESEKETEECRRQMQIYENDFRLEREERLRLGRLNQPDPFIDIREPPGYTATKPPSPDMIRQYQEYCQLVVAKNRMADRIAQLEQRGVDKYMQQRQRHDMFFGQMGYNARGSQKPPTPDDKPEDSMFYGGDVVPDMLSSQERTRKAGETTTCRFCKIQFNDQGELQLHRNFCQQ